MLGFNLPTIDLVEPRSRTRLGRAGPTHLGKSAGHLTFDFMDRFRRHERNDDGHTRLGRSTGPGEYGLLAPDMPYSGARRDDALNGGELADNPTTRVALRPFVLRA